MEQTVTKFQNVIAKVVAHACIFLHLPKTRYSLKTRASAGRQNIVYALLIYRWPFNEVKLYTTIP